LTQNLSRFPFAANLDMNVEIFRLQNHVPALNRSASSARQHGLAETIEYDTGEYAADARNGFS